MDSSSPTNRHLGARLVDVSTSQGRGGIQDEGYASGRGLGKERVSGAWRRCGGAACVATQLEAGHGGKGARQTSRTWRRDWIGSLCWCPPIGSRASWALPSYQDKVHAVCV